MARYTYVISDIHGQMQALASLLNKVGFSAEDELYILGDVIDRGPNSVDCIQWIMEQDNVLTILGNHELLFYDNYIHNAPGVYNTVDEVRRVLSGEQQKDVISWIEKMPECKLISIEGRKYFLNHAQIPRKEYFQTELTDRLFPDYSVYTNYYSIEVKEFVCIHGHIPTLQMRSWNNQNKSNRIWKNKTETIIDIDCGAGYPKEGGCFGCLRLNDMKEFYVEV